jgi:NADPH:quinone reductase
MRYKRVVVTRRGPPDVLQVVESELRQPRPKEVRVKVLATCVCLPDVQARYGQTPFPPRLPFTPGYAAVGIVDAFGDGVTQASIGDRVAALMIVGGYAEYVFLPQNQLIPVPITVDPADAVTLVLNYLVAYQSLHRAAKVKPGDKVLIVGASGGIGTAFLQLGKLADLKMYGLASTSKHRVLTEYGATPIDYRLRDFVEVIREAEPGGLDAVFDGMGGSYFDRCFSLLRRGGTLVEYGNPLSLPRILHLLTKSLVLNLLPNGRIVKPYGTTTSQFGRRPYVEDWATLFGLLEEGKIKPVIAGRLPLLEAMQANALLEGGQVVGNLVLVAPELLEASGRAASLATGEGTAATGGATARPQVQVRS